MTVGAKLGSSLSTIAWSKVGLIAFAAKPTLDDPARVSQVYTSYIHCTDGEHWDIAKPQLLEDVSRIHDNAQIAHLSWSFFGVELACIDASGRLSIFLHNGLLNHLSCVYQSPSPTDGFSAGIVGFRWLNMNKPILLNNPATRQGDKQFHYGIHKVNPLGPWHPHPNKQACIGVIRSGKVKFWYQQDVRYHEIVQDLETDLLPENYYNIASFGSDRDNTLILAVYSATRHILKLFRISIQWKVLATGGGTMPQSKPDAEWATIQVKRIYSNELYCPNRSQRELTHLEVVSPTNHPESRLAVYAVHSSDKGSTIQKIEVVTVPIMLHSNFEALGLRRNPVPDHPSDVVQFQNYHDLYKRLIGLSSLYADNIICCTYADGSVEMRQRLTFAETLPQFNPQSVHNLYDAGFGFPEAETALEICISPNMVAFVLLNATGQLKLYYMRPVLKVENNDASAPIAAAIALRHTLACYSTMTCDDIILIASVESLSRPADFQESVLKQTHRAIGFSLDLPKDVQADKFLVLPSLQKLLSLQASLGTQSGWRRSPAGVMAWASINLRLFSFALTFTLKATHQKQPGGGEGDVKGDTIMTFLGLARWCIDFLAYLNQDLFELGRNPDKFLKADSVSLPLIMLLGAVPRLLIRYTLRGLRGLEQLIVRHNSKADSDPFTRLAYQQLDEILRSGPVQVGTFEKLVNDVDNFMRTNFQDPAERLVMEQSLFFNARIPFELHSVVHRIRAVYLQRIKSEIDIPTLYFYPTKWLGITERYHVEEADDVEIDGLRKQLMKVDDRPAWRRCVRCGSIASIEDLTKTYNKFPSMWTVAFQRNCICGSSWVRCSDRSLLK
ncbi:mediator complex, subunit Med16 [Lipomyces chichibuensis]|uniref:mediator complex, subunit Med16 n=1 Tax=Lipomyces chichibuensis TaxID=1546026 RepID=UPI0033430926